MTADQRIVDDFPGDSFSRAPLVPLVLAVQGENAVIARSVGEHVQSPSVPDGYSIHPSFSDHQVIMKDGRPDALIDLDGQKILLRNRYFFEVDWTLNSRLSERLLAGLKKAKGTFLILELAGGYESACAIQIGTTTEDLHVSNVDIFLQNSVPAAHEEAVSKVTPVLANVINLPFADESHDLVFSSRSLMYLHAGDILRTFSEIARVLKPGGEAIFYDLPRTIYEGDYKKRLEEKLEVNISLVDSNSAPGIVVTFQKPEPAAEDPVTTLLEA